MSDVVKFLEPLLYPVGLLWLLNLGMALRATLKAQWMPALFCWMIVVLLIAFGSTDFSARLVASLEKPYQSQHINRLPPADAIVMLGGTLGASGGDFFGFDFNLGVDRIITAAELARRQKAKVLVLGGGTQLLKGGSLNESEALKRWLAAWGLPSIPVITLPSSSNTHDEAMHTAALVKERKWQRVILVTSAYHMRRSQAVFQSAGVQVVPYACDFLGSGYLQEQRPFSPIPKIKPLLFLDIYLHEIIGYWYYQARGWIGPAPSAQPPAPANTNTALQSRSTSMAVATR